MESRKADADRGHGRYRPWQPHEDALIRRAATWDNTYEWYSWATVAERLGRAVGQVSARARRLGIRRPDFDLPAEDAEEE